MGLMVSSWFIPHLAQAAPPPQTFLNLSILLGSVMLFTLVAGVTGVVLYRLIKRRLTHEAMLPPEGFALLDLRKLRDKGELSEAEYERARTRAVANARCMTMTPEEREAEAQVHRQAPAMPENPDADDGSGSSDRPGG